MKVCFITPEFPPMQGGVGDYTSILARAVRACGLDVSLITSRRALGHETPIGTVSGVATWGFGSFSCILRHLQQVRPDVLHIQYQTAGYGMHPAINLLPLRLRLGWQQRIVTTFHDLKVPYLFPKAGRIRSLPATLLAGYSDAVIATNAEDLAQISIAAHVASHPATAFRQRPLYAIPIGSNIRRKPPDGYDRETWRIQHGVGRSETLLSYFGFFNSSKGVETLLSAFEILLRRGSDVKLLLAGGPYGDSDPTNQTFGKGILARIEQSWYKDLVLKTGFVGAEQVSAALLASDICVLPYHEGASLRHGTLMAAIEHHLPIVTTKGGYSPSGTDSGTVGTGLPELDGKVLLVPPKDAEALAEALIGLIASEVERVRLREAMSKLAPAFAWETIAEQHLAVYRSLLAEL